MLYQKDALQHFSFAESPLSKEEKKEELRRLSQRMEALQLSVKQNDLPVIVLVEGWGTSGKGSRIAAMIRQMDPRFFQVVSTEAPTAEEKAREFAKAPSGITGLETAFSVCNTYLVQPGKLTPMQLVDRMSKAPAEIYGLTDRAVQAGNFARLVLLDWDTEKVYETYKSKGINTPYTGKKLTGSPKAIVTGMKVTE